MTILFFNVRDLGDRTSLTSNGRRTATFFLSGSALTLSMLTDNLFGLKLFSKGTQSNDLTIWSNKKHKEALYARTEALKQARDLDQCALNTRVDKFLKGS